LVVEEVADPKKEISLAEAKRKKSGCGDRDGDSGSEANGRAGTHCGADGETSDSAESA